ncbi:HNH endonuclease [Sphingobacterium pedocola]|uniref:HNH nuclease domain-containing protein n=1 Tax=Sphingobacterium pedocola TaxID=2082722 RepID=A0ABR9T8G5_9SPHI|nr:HNH endonuclease signature motif containing protein [Sphingobacterium pedocola]MBE8721179.1 hypothetical protein [Sphingobacterium pedocola]
MQYILDNVIKILGDTEKPLSAREIKDKLVSEDISRPRKTDKAITTNQIRRAIRDDNGKKIETMGPSPFTFKLKRNFQNLWVLKTVHEDNKASQTVDSYEDSLSEYYNYDNLVPNSKQIVGGDLAILIDKEKILGFARIDSVEASKGKKTVRRCPECPSTTIDKRKTKKPAYRCNKGHEFEIPVEEIKAVTKYRANFNSYFSIEKLNNDLKQLRPFYIKGYNQNMSMQRLDISALSLFRTIEEKLSIDKSTYSGLAPDQGYTKEDEEPYKANNQDEREIALRAIKLRRGQQDFRKKLLERFDNTCVITGCKIIDILEAAHIRPYKGKNDNHPSNGLLLRADIHTLFDLNLVTIDPEKFFVHFHPRVKNEYALYDGTILFNDILNKPNKEALALHFNIFESIILKNL